MKREGKRRRALRDDRDVRAAYEAHGGELYRFALRAYPDPGEAEEVVQETFLRAWGAADRFDPARASLRTWLFTIARNLIRDGHRARSARPWRQRFDDVTANDAAAGLVDDPADRLLNGWLVEEALGRITSDHRQAIVETYLKGRSYDEVAAELGIPASTLRSRVYYGLKALRVAMDEKGVTW